MTGINTGYVKDGKDGDRNVLHGKKFHRWDCQTSVV